MSRARRVAIIGANGFHRSDERLEIQCYQWNRVTDIANPSDYDAIVMNLVSLENPDTVNWDGFFDRFTPLTTLEVLANRGNIVIVGDPRFRPDELAHVPGQHEESGQPFLSWTGIDFDWDEKPGKTITPLKGGSSTKPYLDYVARISGWDYCLKGCEGLNQQLATLGRVLRKSVTQFSSRFELERICENRYGGLIVFAVKLSITEMKQFGIGDYRPSGNSRQGRIIFLPQIEMHQDEVVAMVLTGVLGTQVVVPEPPWASAIVSPGQADVDARITQIKDDLAASEVHLKNAEMEREKVRRCVHLLYKLGDELEDAVREILEALGATVEPPVEKGKEDGWLTVEIEGKMFEGVLEIKGTRKDHFSLDGLRQLMEWKKRGILNRQKKYKGIFVGNSGAEKDVYERKVPFVKSWTDTGELDELVVLLTRDLYSLYCLNCEGKLDKDQFWRMLFETNGVFSLDGLGLAERAATEKQI